MHGIQTLVKLSYAIIFIVKFKPSVYGFWFSSGLLPLPRSLTRCARSFGCGERCMLYRNEHHIWRA
ncbi:hypothetical protein ZW03_23860 [Salmonella enterica subsp. enterica serovar Newport]|nr:hypothetical protein [Salmonella enterica subsp. enterica serovar Newport]EDJ8896758.1 hypothetical protein [Salmonella enterica subsp. enterica serovar Newport]